MTAEQRTKKKQDDGGTSLTAGEAVSVSDASQLPHDGPVKFTPLIDEAARLVVERADLYRAGKCGVMHMIGGIEKLIMVVWAESGNASVSAMEHASRTRSEAQASSSSNWRADSPAWQPQEPEQNDHSAALLPADPLASPPTTETLPDVGEARERLNTQLRCMADEIRAWGTVVEAKVDDAIDDLIVAAALTERARLRADGWTKS